MYEFIRNLISEPFYALSAVLIIWLILYLTLIKTKLLSKKTWIRFEYFWIGVGFLGLLTIVAENKKQYKTYQLESVKTWLKNDYESLSNSLNYRFPCMQFQNTGLFSQEEFDRRQARADSLCDWSKKMKIIVDSAILKGYVKIENIANLQIESISEDYDYQEVFSSLSKINELIEKRNTLMKDAGNNFWAEFKYTFGVLLLFIAFGLRLAMITKKIEDEKIKNAS